MEEKERYIIDRFDEDIFDTKKEYYPSNQTILEIINKQDKRIKELEEENQQLKQQLAEKDAEIKQLKLDLGMFRSVNEFLNGYGIEKAREVLLQTEKTKRQDKISFALDILEELVDCSTYINSKLDFECGSYVSEKAIRDKIKYLKGKKTEDNLFITINDKEIVLDVVKIDNQINGLKGDKVV